MLCGYGTVSWIEVMLMTLAPGSQVLDLCAAPGGKTAQLIKAGYAVTALDRVWNETTASGVRVTE